MLVLRPVGRGNWKPLYLQLSGGHLPLPIEVHVGMRIDLAGRTFRVVRLHP